MFYLPIREDNMTYKTTSTLVLTVVLAIGLALVVQYGIHPNSVLAKSSSHKSSSSSGSDSSSSSSKSSSEKLRSLVSCETSSSKTASGRLSQSDVMNCFSHAYGNATGTSNSTSSAAAATLH